MSSAHIGAGLPEDAEKRKIFEPFRCCCRSAVAAVLLWPCSHDPSNNSKLPGITVTRGHGAHFPTDRVLP